jgi:hypothetical protein
MPLLASILAISVINTHYCACSTIENYFCFYWGVITNILDIEVKIVQVCPGNNWEAKALITYFEVKLVICSNHTCGETLVLDGILTLYFIWLGKI